jgi:hypothetical protein
MSKIDRSVFISKYGFIWHCQTQLVSSFQIPRSSLLLWPSPISPYE